MISVLAIWVLCLLINLMSINVIEAYLENKADVGLFDWDDDAWFIYCLGPIGTFLLIAIGVISLIEYGIREALDVIKCPKWLRKFNIKIS